jgi:hypothetical protein
MFDESTLFANYAACVWSAEEIRLVLHGRVVELLLQGSDGTLGRTLLQRRD